MSQLEPWQRVVESCILDAMRESPADQRTWCPTDRPGELIAVSCALEGVQIMSVQGSHRHWRETHDTYTLAIVHPSPAPAVARWRTRNRTVSTGSGGIMAMEPGDIHVTERLEARAGVADFDVVKLAPELVAHTAERLGLRGDFHFKSPTSDDRPAFDALGRLVHAVAQGETGLALECASVEALTVLVERLGEGAPLHGVRLDPERDIRLRRVKAYLTEHEDRRPGLAELARLTGLTESRLCERFKVSYGTSIGKWWNALRLQRAVRRLDAGASIQMVVSEFGYTDEPYFTRVFKSHYGITPGVWRGMAKANDRVGLFARRRTYSFTRQSSVPTSMKTSRVSAETTIEQRSSMPMLAVASKSDGSV